MVSVGENEMISTADNKKRSPNCLNMFFFIVLGDLGVKLKLCGAVLPLVEKIEAGAFLFNSVDVKYASDSLNTAQI